MYIYFFNYCCLKLNNIFCYHNLTLLMEKLAYWGQIIQYINILSCLKIITAQCKFNSFETTRIWHIYPIHQLTLKLQEGVMCSHFHLEWCHLLTRCYKKSTYLHENSLASNTSSANIYSYGLTSLCHKYIQNVSLYNLIKYHHLGCI